MKDLGCSRGVFRWVILAATLLLVASSSLAVTTSILTRWSVFGGVTVLKDGVVWDSFDLPINPHGVAVNADASILYATDLSDHTLSKIVIASHQVVGTLATGKWPLRVTLNSAETRLYVANSGTNDQDATVSIIDTASFTILHNALAPPHPKSVFVGPNDEFLYVGHDGSNETDRVSKLSAVDGTVIDSIEFGQDWPGPMAVTPDGSELLIGLESSSEIARVDLASFTLMEIVPVSHRPSWLEFHPSGSPLYMSSWFDDAVLMLNPEDLQNVGGLVENLPTPAGTDITPDGKHLHVLMGGNHDTFIIDTATMAVVDLIDVGGNSRGFGEFIPGEYIPPDDVPATSRATVLILVATMLGLATLSRRWALPRAMR